MESLQLNQLSIDEKLSLMEDLWEDLCEDAEDVPSPNWHGAVLSDRVEQYEAGKSSFSSLKKVKERLNDEIE